MSHLRTCIVADDETGMRALITRALSKQFQVLGAADGSEALALLATHPCDLLVTDLAMPGREGIETIRIVRKQYPSVKILAISGVYGEDVLLTARFLGAHAYLEKPFTPDTLMTAVRALVDPVPE